MTFLPKLVIFIAGFNLISAKSHYHDYPYQPFRNFHIPWPVKFPQPLISIDGAWPISPPGMYPYYPSKEYEEYPYPEADYQQELLVQSLNQALVKLNQLLAPNSQETTPFPPSTKPEVLVEALNKAIDRLGVLLTRQQSTELKAPETVAATEKVPSIVKVPDATEMLQQSTMVPEAISNSVNSAIDELNKLFATLPNELKNKPSEAPVTNNVPNKPFLSNPAPFISPENMANPLFLSQTNEGMLFTSNVLEQNKPQENIVPNIDESKLFTSLETTPTPSGMPTEPVTTVPTVENNMQSTDTTIPIRNAETDTPETTNQNEESTIVPRIDIRFREKQDTGFIFPDEFEELTNKKKPAVQQEVELPSRFGEQTINPLTVLEFKPSRPPFHPDVFPPNPTPKPETGVPTVDVSDRNKQTTVAQQNPQIVLEYKPSRPPFHPDVYPPYPTPKPQPDSNLQTSTPSVGDRFQSTTAKPVNNPQIVLEYKPSRPPFHPDVYPPYPTPKPQPDSNLQTSTPSVGDRFQSTTAKPVNNPQIVLEYKPSRPPFHPDVYPPYPTPKPQTDSNLQNVDVGDRFQSTTVAPVKSTTEIVFTTTQGIGPYVPTHYYPTPINLEYKPTRPFYAPNPIFYPKPGGIPPGTPWPASSTERPRK